MDLDTTVKSLTVSKENVREIFVATSTLRISEIPLGETNIT